jgi:hypothetical protein
VQKKSRGARFAFRGLRPTVDGFCGAILSLLMPYLWNVLVAASAPLNKAIIFSPLLFFVGGLHSTSKKVFTDEQQHWTSLSFPLFL